MSKKVSGKSKENAANNFTDGDEKGASGLAADFNLKEAEGILERYRLLSEKARDIICMLRLDGQIVEVNQAALKTYGYRREELLRMNIKDLREPSTVSLVAEQLKKADESGIQFEILHIRKDGTKFPVEVNAIGGDFGGERLILSIIRDISQRKRDEADRKFLFEIAEKIRLAETADDLLFSVAEAVGEHLQVRRCLFNEIDLNDDRETVHHDYCRGVESVAGVHRLSVYSSITSADMKAGKTVVNRDSKTDSRTAELYDKTYAPVGERAYIAVPLMRDGRWVASVWVSDDEPRNWSAAEINLLETIGERAWLAVEKLRSEAALSESEERFAKAFNASPLAVTITSLKTGKLIEVNETFVNLTGFSHAEAIGRSTAELGLWDKATDRDKELSTVISDGQIRNSEYRFRMKDGTEIVGLLSAELLELGGEPCALTVIQDITTRNRAENALRESEESYRILAETASDAIIRIDENSTIQFVNTATARIFGYTTQEMMGQSLTMLMPEEIRQKHRDGFGRYLQTGKRNLNWESIEVPARHKGGRLFPLEISFGEYNRDGKRFFIGVARDITERKEAEAEREWLLRSEQAARAAAEDASRLKDEFLATVSHELRTPLNAILGWATMVRKSGFEMETMRRAFEVVERNSRNQNQIISDILEVSRIITGKLNLNLRPLPMTTIIRAAIDTLYPAIEAKHINLETNLEPDTAKVSGDGDRLQQVIWNLLSNAAKFTPDGGTIQITLFYRDNFAEITVTDSGDGIEKDFLPFVFDRFRQADGGATRRHGGLGLGLAIVRNLVELHGGSVSVKSEGSGKGAAFTVRLPVKTEDTETVTPSDNADNAPHGILEGLKILVVDDEPDALELVAFILKGEGAWVFTADSVDKALKIFDEKPIDAVVSDIGMPEKDGYDFISEIKKRTAQIPTVALTAYAGEEDGKRVLQAGYHAYLPKPLEPSELIETIAEIVKKPFSNIS